MRRFMALALVVVVAAAVVCGCAKSTSDKVVVRITDNEGKIPPRTVTAGYVNERLDKMIVPYIPDIPGDEGRRRIIEDVIRKELLVIQALRVGLDTHEYQAGAREFHSQQKAEMMLRADVIEKPSTLSQKDIEDYYTVREMTFQLLEIATETKEEAEAAYKRVTEGGEDFARVAQEISVLPSGKEGGRMPILEWKNYHPLVRVAIQHLNNGDVSQPVNMGNWQVFKVLSRKDPAYRTPLEGQHLAGVTQEAQAFARGLKEHEVNMAWMAAADVQFDEDVLALASTRTDETVAKQIPDMGKPADVETRMARAAAHVVPELPDEEKGKVLFTYKIGGKKKTVTLGDYQEILKGTEGMETPKGDGPQGIERLLRNRVHAEIIAYEIDKRGYRNTREFKDYLAERAEELMVKLLYEADVINKVSEPTPIEVREYYETHRADYAQPPSADVQHVIVPTEEIANAVRQQLLAGQTTFEKALDLHATSSWLKNNKGIVTDYYQGEQRFPYLQEPTFRLRPGEISEPIAAPGGFAIVKVLKRNPERFLTLEEAGPRAAQSLVGERREARLNQLLDEIRATVTIETIDGNLQYVRDTAEVLKEKKAAAGLAAPSRGGQ